MAMLTAQRATDIRTFFSLRGRSARRQGDLKSARDWFCRAVKADPGHPAGWVALGNILRRLSKPRAAAKCLHRALELEPDSPAILANLGNAYKDTGILDRAEYFYRQALERKPQLAEVHCNLAMVLLALGRMQEGWIHYQWRLKFLPSGKDYPERHGLALWKGQPLDGRNILVYDEQGFGDIFLFARYLRLLASRGAGVVFETRRQVLELFSRQDYLLHVLDRDSDRPPEITCHWCSPLASLPLLLGTTMSNIPVPVPYIAAGPEKSAFWEKRLALLAGRKKPGEKPVKIGLFWQNTTGIDPSRSVGLDNLAPLGNLCSQLPAVFFGLQKKPSDSDRKHDWLVMLDQHLTDFDQTAAIIDNLDLVITIDTAVAHLAGAMGKPVWVMLPRTCDWRWFLERTDSPWYPGMRLFRQHKCLDWHPVVRQVTARLKEFIKNMTSPAPAESSGRTESRGEEDLRFARAVELAQKGFPDRAAAIYRRLAVSDPVSAPAACYNLGLLLLQEQKPSQAARWFRRALDLQPDLARAANNLGCALEAAGRMQESREAFVQALKIDPGFGEAAYNLGRICLRRGHDREAARALRLAVETRPGNHLAWNDLAVAYQRLGNLLKAREALRRAVSLKPDFARAYQNLGNVWLDCGEPDTAIDCHAKAIELAGPTADDYIRQAELCRQWLRLKKAREYLEKALEIDPRHAGAHTALAETCLLEGDFPPGWRHFRWRFRLPECRTHIYPHRLKSPRWQGQSLKGRTILAHCEQGYGDTVQFIRYLPRLKQMGARVIAEVHPPLVRLVAAMEAVDQVLALDPEKPCRLAVDYHVPLMDLPGVFNTRLETIPGHTPYLRPTPEATARWSGRLNCGKFKVGLVWQGGVFHRHNSRRNLDPEQLAPLLALKDISFHSLQKFPAGESAPPDIVGYDLTDLGPLLRDFDDTAAAICRLDLIITVDTATAHLAGALARPVWVLLPYLPDWRWLLQRIDSPWYPGMRLFRQLRPGQWDHPLALIRDQLEVMLRRRRLTA